MDKEENQTGGGGGVQRREPDEGWGGGYKEENQTENKDKTEDNKPQENQAPDIEPRREERK